MSTSPLVLALSCVMIALSAGGQALAEVPLPEFTPQGVCLHPDDLAWIPTGELEHPSVIKMEGRTKNPLGKYYMYYAPHKHHGIAFAYADRLDGPWKEYDGNPVIEGPAAADIRWIQEKGKFYMWGHRANKRTELWTSDDGIHFEYEGVSVDAKNIDTRNASYSRVYEYPLEQYGSRYVMLYSGFDEERGMQCIWLAHSKDAENWTQLTTPLVEPIEGEGDSLYCAALFQWKNKNYIVYQDHTAWRGGNVKYFEIDRQLNPVGAGGGRFVLIDPPASLDDRYRSAEFYREADTIYMISGAGQGPRVYAYATAIVGQAGLEDETAVPPEIRPVDEGDVETPVSPSRRHQEVPAPAATSPDDILEGLQLETVYETTFDAPIRVIHEDELAVDGTIARELPQNVDWVLEGEANVLVKDGRMHLANGSHHCVLWNTREFPESFVAEWGFQHHAPQGTAIIFFAAQAHKGGSIFTPGLPVRGGNFGKYTRGEVDCYHISYSATDEEGVPRGETHLKKDGKEVEKNKLTNGLAPIDGKTERPFRLRLAKLGNRIILEIDGEISFDVTDKAQDKSSSYQNGQIGFRQMRHTIESSYGGLKIQQVKSKPGSQ